MHASAAPSSRFSGRHSRVLTAHLPTSRTSGKSESVGPLRTGPSRSTTPRPKRAQTRRSPRCSTRSRWPRNLVVSLSLLATSAAPLKAAVSGDRLQPHNRVACDGRCWRRRALFPAHGPARRLTAILSPLALQAERDELPDLLRVI